MPYTTRVLPPEEWSKLAGTETGAFIDRLAPGTASVLVVEDGAEIVATWALLTMAHVEGLWIAPAHRARFGVVKRLLSGMRNLARAIGCASVQTGSVSDDVTDFIQRLGGVPLPGRAFILPLGERCQQP